MIGRTNCSAGGGGGLPDNAAILRVMAPTGSTVTLTRGGITKASTGHPNAADASQNDYYFIIPQTAFSPSAWTVTATYGGKTDTQTVVIEAADEYDVLMSYDFFLVRNGVLQNSVTIGSLTGSNVTTPTITDEAGYKKIVLPTNSGVAFSAVDYTQFSKVYIDYEVKRGEYFSWIWEGFYTLPDWVNNYDGGMVVYKNITSPFSRMTSEFDLSTNPATYNIFKICTRSTSSSGFDLNIYNLYVK